MNRPLPRNLPELVAHAIDCERDAASRFHLFANHLHAMGYRDMADIFRRLELAERAHLEALNECVAAGPLPDRWCAASPLTLRRASIATCAWWSGCWRGSPPRRLAGAGFRTA